MTTLKGKELNESELGSFDFAIAASSFEPRCLSIPTFMRDVYRASGTAVAFHEYAADSVRKEHDAWYSENGIDLMRISLSEPAPLGKLFYERCEQAHRNTGEVPRVLVDYSSMPKSFYLGILRAAREFGDVDLVYGYDLGGRPDAQWEASEVDKIYLLPGFEGNPTARAETLVMFSMGFDGVQASAVEEILQPRRMVGLIADPGVSPDCASRAEAANRDLISGAMLRSPIREIWGTVGRIRDAIRLRRTGEGIAIVCLGPKPHALALGIVAVENPTISYFHVLTRHPPKRRIEALEERVWTEVRVRRASLLERVD